MRKITTKNVNNVKKNRINRFLTYLPTLIARKISIEICQKADHYSEVRGSKNKKYILFMKLV